jgi:Carbohydrate esterase, sialic acid-specific acetylesterase
MNIVIRRVLPLFIAGIFMSNAAHASPVQDKEHFHLFLLAGQSNMAGRGAVKALGSEARAADPRVLALNRSLEWQPAVDPIHWDKSSAGAGLGKPFGKQIAALAPGITVGLIPAACGGSSISVWAPGRHFDQTDSHPYDDALARARHAMKSGSLKAILWHQGESDTDPQNAPLYEQRLTELIARFRADLQMPELPFIIGQLGRFDGKPWNAGQAEVDRAQQAVAAKVNNVHFVGSQGLTSEDNLHFDTASQKVLAARFAVAYREAKRTGR